MAEKQLYAAVQLHVQSMLMLEREGLQACLVSILKSLVDWERFRRDSSKQVSIVESCEEDASARSLTTDETKSQEDGRTQSERAKAHKSTMEAAISEFNRKPAKGSGIYYQIS